MSPSLTPRSPGTRWRIVLAKLNPDGTTIDDWVDFEGDAYVVAVANDTPTVFIDPGSPWQNAWIESFNGRLRDELLNLWHFDSLLEARVIIEDWRNDYNANRPSPGVPLVWHDVARTS